MSRFSWSNLSENRSARNALASYFAFGSAALKGLISIPIAVFYLSQQELGLWAVVSAFLGYLAWSDLGVGVATGRTMAPAVAKGDQDEIDRWWTITRLALCALGLGLIILGLLCTPVLFSFIEIDSDLHSDATCLWVGGVILSGIGYPLRGVHGLLTAQHRMYWSSIIQAVSFWVHLGTFYILLRFDWGVVSYLGALAAAHMTTWLGFQWCLVTGENRPRLKWEKLEGWRAKQLFSLGGNMTVVGLVDSIIKTMPAVMIARMGGLAMVPIYNFSWRAPNMATDAVFRAFQAFYPQLQRYYVTGQMEEFKRLHENVGWMTLSLSMILAGLVVAMNQTVVGFLASEAYYIGKYANVWFAVALVTLPMSRCFRSLLLLSGSMGKHALVALLKLASAIGLGYLAWQYWSMTGLAALFAILPLFNGVYAYVRGVKACGFEYRNFSVNVIFATVLAIFAVVLLACFSGWDESASPIFIASVSDKVIVIPSLLNILPGILISFVGICMAAKTVFKFKGS